MPERRHATAPVQTPGTSDRLPTPSALARGSTLDCLPRPRQPVLPGQAELAALLADPLDAALLVQAALLGLPALLQTPGLSPEGAEALRLRSRRLLPRLSAALDDLSAEPPCPLADAARAAITPASQLIVEGRS